MRKIVLFGTGRDLQRYVDLLKCFGCEADAYADNNPEKWGKYINGKRIISPEELKKFDADIMISCSFKEEIEEQLRKLGMHERLISCDDLLRRLANQFVVSKLVVADIQEQTTVIIDAFDGFGWGGMEIWSYNVAVGLEKRGHRVKVLGSTWQQKQDDEIERLISRVELVRNDYLQTIVSIIDELKKCLPIVVINNWTEHVFLAAYILKVLYPEYVHIVSFVHNDRDYLYKKQQYWVEEFDKIAGVSQKIVDNLKNYYAIPKEKLVYKENFVQFSPDAEIHKRKEDEAIRICWGGRLEVLQKRADLFPRVIEALNKSDINYILEIAGDGPCREMIENYINDNGLNNRVKSLGYIDRNAMPDFWKNKDIYINFSEFEGASLAMLESMSYGVVPVVTRVSGVDEFVIPGESGYVVDVGDIEGMIKNIVLLAHDELMRQRFAHKAQEMVITKCDFQDYIDYIVGLVEGVSIC